MKTAFINCASGVAGDMPLGAFIQAGVDGASLERRLKRQLGITGWSLDAAVTERYHFPAVTVRVAGERSFSSPREMRDRITGGKLPDRARDRAVAALDALTGAEAAVHRVPVEKVHFHELNSIDTIVDIVGTCLCLDLLGIEEVCASPVNIGNPAPATTQLLAGLGIPVYSLDPDTELATPTGVALLSVIVDRFGPMPVMRLSGAGIGAGMAVTPGRPNVLKLSIGETPHAAGAVRGSDEVVVLETNIDDMDPRLYPYVSDLLFDAGALDVWLTQVLMKKGRPGIVLSVVCDPSGEGRVVDILFRETTTLGVRRRECSRHVLPRTAGEGRKTAFVPGGPARTSVEYEDAKREAVRRKVPLKNLLRRY